MTPAMRVVEALERGVDRLARLVLVADRARCRSSRRGKQADVDRPDDARSRRGTLHASGYRLAAPLEPRRPRARASRLYDVPSSWYQSRIASPQKSAITPPSARKGPSGIADFRASLPCRTKSTIAGTNAMKKPDEHRDDHRDAEAGAEERRQLHIAHAEPARIDEDDHEQHEPGSERAQDPLDARVVDGPEREEHDRAREDDLVGDEPMLEIGAGDHDEHPAEENRDESLEREAVDEAARAREQRRPRRHQREPRRARNASQQRVVERCVRREAVRERARRAARRAARRDRLRRPRDRIPRWGTASCPDPPPFARSGVPSPGG